MVVVKRAQTDTLGTGNREEPSMDGKGFHVENNPLGQGSFEAEPMIFFQRFVGS